MEKKIDQPQIFLRVDNFNEFLASKNIFHFVKVCPNWKIREKKERKK